MRRDPPAGRRVSTSFVTVTGSAVGEVVESRPALVTILTLKAFQAAAVPSHRVTLSAYSPPGVAATALAPPVGVVAIGAGHTPLAGRALRLGGADTPAGVRVTDMARLVAGTALFASAGRDAPEASQAGVTLRSPNTGLALALAGYIVTVTVQGSHGVADTGLAPLTRIDAPSSKGTFVTLPPLHLWQAVAGARCLMALLCPCPMRVAITSLAPRR